MISENDLVVVYAGASVEAGFIKGLLEDKGITTFLKDEVIGAIAPWQASPGGAGAVKVTVRKSDFNKAKVIIQEFKEKGSEG